MRNSQFLASGFFIIALKTILLFRFISEFMAVTATGMSPKKQGGRPHFIEEWASTLDFTNKADFARAIPVHPSLVTQWFENGATPSPASLEKLRQLFSQKTGRQFQIEWLFRHPNDVWFAQFIEGRDQSEVDRIKNMLEGGFPRRD